MEVNNGKSEDQSHYLALLCDELQSKHWDHQKSLYELISNRDDLLIVDTPYYAKIGSLTIYSGMKLYVPDLSYDDNRHFTELIVTDEGVHYYANTTATVKDIKYLEATNLSPIDCMQVITAYCDTIKCIHKLERLRVTNKFTNDCIDLCFSYGHFH